MWLYQIKIQAFEALVYGVNSPGSLLPLSTLRVWNGEGKGDMITLANVKNLSCEPGKIKKIKQIQA